MYLLSECVVFGFYRQIAVIVLAGLTSSGYAQILPLESNSVEAKAWVIYDPQSHQIIAASEETQRRAPASLTKLMVGYLALQAVQNGTLKPNQVVTVPAVVSTVQSDESSMQLKAGEQITVKALIEGLIIMSANDAALTLATLIAGDIPHFLQQMNNTAQQLGMQQTHFSNPSGITMAEHYSSALDIALLSQAIISQTPEYLTYSKIKEFSYKNVKHEATNILLNSDPSVDGLKTGYTAAAGYNLALTAQRLDLNTQQQRRLIVVVLGTASKQKRADVAEQLMNIAFNYTQTRPIFRESHKIADIPVLNATVSRYPVHVPASQSYTSLSLLPNSQILDATNFNKTTQRFSLPTDSQQWLEPLTQPTQMHYTVQLTQQYITAPISEQALHLATIQVSQFQQPIANIDIVEQVNLQQSNFLQRLMAWIKSWIQGVQGHKAQAVIYPIAS